MNDHFTETTNLVNTPLDFNQQRIQTRRVGRQESILLAIVSVLLLLWSLKAGIWYTPEALRYEYDLNVRFGSPEKQPAYQEIGIFINNGTVKGGLLNQACGDGWYNSFYGGRDDRIAKLQSCNITPEQQLALLNTAQTRLIMLQKQINTKIKYFIDKENTAQKDANHLNFADPQPEPEYIKQSLGLSTDGEAIVLTQMNDYIRQLIQPNIQHPNNKDQLLAALAVADGDTAFPYNALFADSALNASNFNEAAGFVRKVGRSNLEWAAKALKAQNIIKPYKGMLIFIAMAWLAYFFINIARRQNKPVTLLAIVLVAWGLMGLALNNMVLDLPKHLFVTMIGIGIITPFVLTQNVLRNYETGRSTAASRLGYPLFVGFLGLGFLILTDLSVRGHIENRYLINLHFNGLFLAFVMVSIIPPLAFVVGQLVSRFFAGLMLVGFWPKNLFQRLIRFVWLFLLLLLLIFVVKAGSTNNATEILKLWMIFGVAAFLSVSRFQLKGRQFISRKSLIMMFVVLLVPFIGMVAIGEMGNLLVVSYAAIIFIAGVSNYATAADFFKSNFVAITVSVTLVVGLTLFVLGVGSSLPRTAERIDSWLHPFSSVNDQLAIIHWFRNSAPFFGYNLGHIPWCGFADARCYVPKQMQSDYTATSIMVIFGTQMGLAVLWIYVVWLLHLIKGQFLVNQGVVNVGRHQSLVQVFLLWAGVSWALITVVQMIVTLAGNLGAIPLTGITLPFISYGMSSLVICSFFIGLLINRPFFDTPNIGEGEQP